MRVSEVEVSHSHLRSGATPAGRYSAWAWAGGVLRSEAVSCSQGRGDERCPCCAVLIRGERLVTYECGGRRLLHHPVIVNFGVERGRTIKQIRVCTQKERVSASGNIRGRIWVLSCCLRVLLLHEPRWF